MSGIETADEFPRAGFAAIFGRSRRVFAGYRRLKVAFALALGDAAIASAVTVAATATVAAFPAARVADVWVFVDSALLLVSLHFFCGLYDGSQQNPVERFRFRALAACLHATIVTVAAGSSQSWPLWIVLWALLVLGLTIGGTLAQFWVRAVLIRQRLWMAPAVIVGGDDAGRDVARILEEQPELGFSPVACLTGLAGETADPAPSASSAGGHPWRPVSTVEVALVLSSGDPSADARRANSLPFPTVILLRDFGEMPCLWLQNRVLGKSVGIEMRRNLLLPHNLLMKRALDVALAIPLLLLALPAVVVLALMIRIVDGGPAFFSQIRVGRDGRPVRVLKLRTMYRDAELRLETFLAASPEARQEWSQFFKLSSDPRILPGIGSFLRRSSIDEFPQLWNILRGDMSFVGPRPFPAYHLAGFDAEFRTLRASVMPGLTGIWQITSRSDGCLDLQKSEDTFYIRNWSIWLDLYIIVHTLPAVMLAKGAR